MSTSPNNHVAVRLAIYAVVTAATIVGLFLVPWRSPAYIAILLAGMGLMLLIGRLFGQPWGRL